MAGELRDPGVVGPDAGPAAVEPTNVPGMLNGDPGLADALEVFRFDPFAQDIAATEPEAQESTGGTLAAPESGDVGTQGVSAEPAGAAPLAVPGTTSSVAGPAVQEPAAPTARELELTKELERLRADMTSVAALRQEVEALKRGASGPAAGGPGPAPDADMPAYMFDLPDELVNGLASEETSVRKRALQFLVQGVGRAIHQEMAKVVENKVSIVPQMVLGRVEAERQAAGERERVRTDFYGRWPALAKPELEEFVAVVGRKVADETGLTEWSPALRDAIGARAMSILGMGGAAAGPPPVQTSMPAPAPPPVRGTNGTRSSVAAPSGGRTELDLIYDTLFR